MLMEKTITSDSMNFLLEQLAGDIRSSESGIFTPTTLVTQSGGMNGWLKTELARKNRVFTNFKFLNQEGLFEAVYELLTGELLRNSSDIIRYRIYDVLGKEDFRLKYEQVANYYEGNELRRMQLAVRLADLFDQYQLYREDIIETWEKGTLSGNHEAEAWQQYLWTALAVESKGRTRDSIISMLRESGNLVKATYPEIFVFGISIFTGFHRDFLRELSEITNVHFYIYLASNEDEYNNELLQSYGSKVRELADLFPAAEHHSEPSDNGNLLGRIQNNIKANVPGIEYIKDDSVHINSCFTPAREAECLYDYLLRQFDEDNTLEPGDILVMTSDINKYAPYIRAVFKNDPKPIPIRISGADNNTSDSMVSALELIMTFTEDDLTSEKVVSMLEHKRIKRAFGIEDSTYVRQVVKNANIRFGWENSTADDTGYVSWKYGLEKLLLGYAMYTEEEYPGSGGTALYPYRDAEAAKSYDLFRLKAFVVRLLMLFSAQKEVKRPVDWKTFLLEEVLDKMIYRDDFNKDDRKEHSDVYRALSYIERMEVEEEIPYPVFLEDLKMKLFLQPGEVQLNTGFVTVTPPVPVRGLPARVICFLGLDNGVFPRRDRFAGFDLMGEEYRKGDRSKLENDKFIFLDTLLTAGDRLYLSYTGQSVKDNKSIPASIVVDTLTDYLGDKNLVIEHPLHGFSSRYNSDDKELYTYFYSETSHGFESKEPGNYERNEMNVRSFVSFFEHPIQWYFNEVLGIYYDEEDDTLPETEIFELDGLQKWQVKNDLVFVNTGEEMESYILKGKMEGRLPLGNASRLAIDELEEEIKELRTKYRVLTENIAAQDVHVELNTGDLRITGIISDIYDGKYLSFSVSKTKETLEKQKVRALINTLLLASGDYIRESAFLDHRGAETAIPVPGREEAVGKLKLLAGYLLLGTREPLKFTVGGAMKVRDTKKIENIFKDEAEPSDWSDLPPDMYVKFLYDNGYLEDFDVEHFNKHQFDTGVYDDPKYEEIRELARLLNIIKEQS